MSSFLCQENLDSLTGFLVSLNISDRSFAIRASFVEDLETGTPSVVSTPDMKHTSSHSLRGWPFDSKRDMS